MNRVKAQAHETALIQQLKAIRLERGLSHERLAQMTGLSRAAISLVESGERHPTLLTCLRIAQALNITILFQANN